MLGRKSYAHQMDKSVAERQVAHSLGKALGNH